MERFALPPGYTYEAISVEDEDELAIVDRAAVTVFSVPLEYGMFSVFDAIRTIWRILECSPELAGIHTAAFLTWRLGDSPLDRLVEP